MAFLATNQIPVNTYVQAKNLAATLRSHAITHIARAADGFDAAYLLGILSDALASRQQFQQLAAVPGLAAYAQAQEGSETYDVAAEFQAMLATLDALTNWIIGAIPRDANQYVLLHTLGAQGQLVPRAFTPAQLAPLVTRLEALRDTVA